MKAKLALLALLWLLTFLTLSIVVWNQANVIRDQRTYIDMGCHGRYQGAE